MNYEVQDTELQCFQKSDIMQTIHYEHRSWDYN